MAVVEDLSEEERYLLALMLDQSGIDMAEFLWKDETNQDGVFRCYDFQIPWYRDQSKFQIDQAARSVGKSLGIQMRAFAFPFHSPGEEMLLTAPELIHLNPITERVEERIMESRVSSELLKKRGASNGITHRPFEAKFVNGARIVGRIPQKDGKGVKGQHPKQLEMDEAQDYPECFPEGTLVLTRSGYRRIETIQEGDEVFTHRRRWRKVTSTATRVRDTVRVVGQGHPGMVVSSKHRFYAINEQEGRVFGGRSVDGHPLLTPVLTFSGPEWVEARDMVGSWWSTPARFPKVGTPPSAVHVGGRREGMGWSEGDPNTLWLLGLYLADGSIGFRGDAARSVTFTVHIDEEDEVLRRCEQAGFVPAASRQVGGSEKCVGITLNDPRFASWLLRHCGHGAHEKQVPVWVYGLRSDWRRSVLAGALFGDGCDVNDGRYQDGRWKFSTVGKAQAAAIKTLATTLGYVTSWYWVQDADEREIRGRRFRLRDGGWYQVVGSPIGQAFDHDLLRYQRVRSVHPGEPQTTLYDLGVDEDESFVAEGIVVHNSGWVELGETLKYGNEEAIWRAHGVSRGVRDRFYKQTQEGSGWTVHRITAMHRPDWSQAERENKAELYGSRDHPDYRRNILGMHGDAQSALFVLARLMACFIKGTQVQSPTGPVPIEEVKAGDRVLNALGTGTVLKAQESLRDQLVRVTLGNGSQFICTPEHPFLTAGGWRHADGLGVGDWLIAQREAVRVVRGDHHFIEGGEVLREELRRELAWGGAQQAAAEEEQALRMVRSEVLSPPAGDSLLWNDQGSSQGPVADVARVASVEALQPGDPEFDRLSREDGDEGRVRVYDLTISGHPSFTVGDEALLVHNCVDSTQSSDYNEHEYHHVRITDEKLKDSGLPIEALLRLPGRHKSYGVTWAGMDVGLTNHPSEVLVFGETNRARSSKNPDPESSVLKLLTRIHLERISAPDQRKVLEEVFNHYRPRAISMDRTGLGLPIYQEIMADGGPAFQNSIRAFNFSEKIVVGYEQEEHDPERWWEDYEPDEIMANVLEYCVDDQTEALTRSGWKRHDQLQAGDEVWGVDPETWTAGWTPVRSVHRFTGSRPMLSLESRVHSSLTTGQHRWLTERYDGHQRRIKREWRTSSSLVQGSRIPLAAPSVDASAAIHSDAFVELVAWFWTEGCHHWGHRHWCGASLGQSRKANPGHVDRIESCLRLEFGDPGRSHEGGAWYATERDGMVEFHLSEKVASVLRDVVSAPEKVVDPAFIAGLTHAQLGLFIDVSLAADGSVGGDGVRVLAQSSEQRIRSFEMACVLAGIPVHTHHTGSGMWSCRLLKRTRCRPLFHQSEESTSKWVHHDGVVWCPETGTGTWLARRNGTVYYTGNSSDMLRLLVDTGRLWLPWDVELIREFQGQTYQIAKSTTNPYGRKVFSQGEYHALDAARMAVLGFFQEQITLLEGQQMEPILDSFITG